MNRSDNIRSRKLRAMQRVLATGLLAAMTSACGAGAWFGDEEEILEGERIPIRSVASSAAETPRGSAQLPPARAIADWPQAGGNAMRAVLRADGALQLEREWSRSIGAGSDSESRITAEPVVANGRIFSLDAAAEVSARDAASGDRLWDADLTPEDEHSRDGFGGGVAVSGDRVVVSTGFGEIIALNAADGERLWTYKAASPFRAAPAISDGLAFVVARNGELIALDLATGEQRWSATNVEGGASMLGGAGPAVSGEVVAAPFSSGDIGIFRLRDGRRGWSESLGAPRRGSALALIADVSSAPVMSGGKIFAGGVSGRLVAFDIPSGERLWARDIGVYNRAWAAGGVIFVISEDARLYALDADNGRSIWELRLPRYDDPENRADPFAYGGPILVGDALYLTSSEESLFEISAASGDILREIDIPGASSIPPVFANGLLYVLDESGDLHAYR